MTPKEKASELFDKYYRLFNNFPNYQYVIENINTIQDEKLYTAKQCALIAVDELICEVYNISHQYTAIYDITTSSYLYTDCKELTYWNNVKQEIEAL